MRGKDEGGGAALAAEDRMEAKMNKGFASITVGIAVSDLEKAKGWYRQLVGEVEELEPAAGIWEFEIAENAWLQLMESDRVVPGTGILRFASRDIDEAHALAERLGGNPSPIGTEEGVVRYFDFEDPFGNKLPFYQVL